MQWWMLFSLVEGIIVGVLMWFMNARRTTGIKRLSWYVVILAVMVVANAIIMPISEDFVLIKVIMFAIFALGVLIGMLGTDPMIRVMMGTYKRDSERRDNKAG